MVFSIGYMRLVLNSVCCYSIIKILLLFITSLLYAPQAYGDNTNIYVVIHDFHSGIVIKKSDISLNYLSNVMSFDNAKYIEIGFGDKRYYMSENPGFSTGVPAILLPTKSVMHVVKISQPLKQTFPYSRVFNIPVSQNQLRLLLQYIRNSFLIQNNEVSPIGNSLYLEGNFYNGKLKFHLFNTCHTWVAKALKHAGLNINPSLVNTDNALIDQIAKWNN